MPLDRPGEVTWFDVDPCFVFRVGNAHEDAAGRIVLEAPRHGPADAIAMWGEVAGAGAAGRPGDDATGLAQLHRWTLDPATEERIDDRLTGRHHRYLYTRAAAGTDVAVVEYDTVTGASTEHVLGTDVVLDEAEFVASPPSGCRAPYPPASTVPGSLTESARMAAMTTPDVHAITADLTAAGVAGVTISWADNNGIPRSRTVPVATLPRVAEVGVGITSLFAVFDSADAITFAHADLATPSGDVRLLPVLEGLVPLAGQPALAWAPGRQLAADGGPWPYDQRAVLERQVETLAAAGLTALVGYEMEFGVYLDDGTEPPAPAHHGPAYSPHALVAIDGFVADVLRDCAANGLELGQLHAEYGPAQMELSLGATDPVTAADNQLLARQTLRTAPQRSGTGCG